MEHRYRFAFIKSCAIGIIGCALFLLLRPAALPQNLEPKPQTQPVANSDNSANPIHLDRARFDSVKGIRILHLYGSTYEMGQQQGRLLKTEIHTLIRQYLDKFLGPDVKQIGLHAARNFFLPHIPQTYQDEMRGLAETADIDFDTVLLAQCFLDINRSLACSTIAIHPNDNALSESMLLRNLDFPSLGLAEKHSILIVRHPAQGRSTVSVGWPLLLGTLSGFNQDGLALAMMESYGTTSAVKGMPYNLLYRHCLENCADTAAARLYMHSAAITSANNLSCIDKSGDAAVFELSNAKIAIRNAEQSPIYATNHFVSSELNKGKRCDRFERLNNYFADYQHDMDLASAETLLAAVAIKSINLQSFVLLPQSQRIHLCLGKLPACDGPFVTLDKTDLGLE